MVAIPTPRERLETFRFATTDQAGRFTIASLSPGDYRVFSWESMELNAYYDPEFVKPYEPRGVLVHLTESGSATADVKMIPSQ